MYSSCVRLIYLDFVFQILKFVTQDYFLEYTLTYAAAETSRNFVLLLVISWLLLCLTHVQSM